MTVLYIIGFIAVLITIFLVTAWLDGFSKRKYGYKFFTWGSLLATGIGYAMIYFGKRWLLEAIAENGDLLNGQILIGLGILLVLAVLIYHIRNTSLWFGLIIGVYQLLLYIPASIIGGYILLAAVAFAAQTKPVYNIN